MTFQFREPVYGSGDTDYILYVLPGIAALAIMFMGSGLAGIMLTSDNKQGTLIRVYAAGLLKIEIIASHLITQMLLSVAQISVLNIVLYFCFGIVCQGSYATYYVICIFVGICGTSLGLLLGIIFENVVENLIVNLFLTFSCLMMCGIIFPLERMTIFWQTFSKVLPLTLPTIALRSVVVKGLGWTDPSVWQGFGVLVLWTIVCLLGCVMVFRKLFGRK